MPSFWKKGSNKPTRHVDPDEAVAKYLEQLHQADVAGASPPASALNGLGDAYLDKDDVASAVDYYRQAAEIYAREGMHTNAIACLKKVRRHAVDEGDVGLLLGRYYAAKRLIPDALAELEAFADRQEKIGNRKRAIEALREVVRLVPDDGRRYDRLGDLLREDGQEDAAVDAYREALRTFVGQGNDEAAERLRTKVEDLGGEPAPSPEPAPSMEPAEESSPAAEESPVSPPEADPEEADLAPRPADPPPEPEVLPEEPEVPPEEPEVPEVPPEEPRQGESEPDEPADPEGELALDLEIERTSYRDQQEEAIRRAQDDEEQKLTVAQQTSSTEGPVEPVEIQGSSLEEEEVETEQEVGEEIPEEEADQEKRERYDPFDLDGSPALSDAAADLEKAVSDMEKPEETDAGRPEEEADSKPILPEPRSHEEMVALAEQHVRAGETDQAGKYLLLAAEGLREEKAWQDAAHAYRRLAEIGEAKAEDFEDWIECARQAGRANAVLEALSTAARWHLKKGDVAAARRSAEEMLLVDPDSETASEILERIGTLPSD